MNEKRAQQEGLSFTGIYVRSYESDKAKERAKEIRKQGYKAVMVQVDGGVSVYAEEKYFIDKQMREIKKRLAAVDRQKEYAKEKYEQELQKIEDNRLRMEKMLAELEQKQ